MIPNIKPTERTQEEWNRKAANAVNALAQRLSQEGPTAERPVAPVVSQYYYDTTLSKPIWWSGAVWKDAAGTSV